MQKLKKLVATALLLSLMSVAVMAGETASPPGETSTPPGETNTPPAQLLAALGELQTPPRSIAEFISWLLG